MQQALTVIPLTLKAANAFVGAKHRHSMPTSGCKFAVGCCGADGVVVGVAICGRPVARALDNGITLEVLRVCTDGSSNACSFLYGASRRVGRAMGYQKIITYTLKSEGGVSLRAAGARPVAEVIGGEWDRPNRKRATQSVYKEDKIRWEL